MLVIISNSPSAGNICIYLRRIINDDYYYTDDASLSFHDALYRALIEHFSYSAMLIEISHAADNIEFISPALYRHMPPGLISLRAR